MTSMRESLHRLSFKSYTVAYVYLYSGHELHERRRLMIRLCVLESEGTVWSGQLPLTAGWMVATAWDGALVPERVGQSGKVGEGRDGIVAAEDAADEHEGWRTAGEGSARIRRE